MHLIQPKFAARAIVVILFLLLLFQIALILGAPLGHFAWGGQHETLPTGLRIGSVCSIALYILFSLIALSRTKQISWFFGERVSYIGSWIITAYSFLGILMNAASRSSSERNAMTPVAIILFVLFLIVSRSKSKQ